jgi:putative nucleotidyltransferase with HDIG domain
MTILGTPDQSFQEACGGLRQLQTALRAENQRLLVYAGALATGAMALLCALLAAGFGLNERGSLLPIAAFAVLALLAERQSVRLTESLEMSVAFLPLLFVAVVYGPVPAAITGAMTVAGEFRAPYLRWLIWTSSRTIVGGAAGVAAYAAWNVSQASVIVESVAATAASALVCFALDFLFNSITLTLRQTGTALDVLRAAAPVAVVGVPIYTSLVGLIAYAYVDLTAWSAALFFIPAFAAQRYFVLYREQRDAARDLAEANHQLERANLSFASALVATLDARDQYTAGHSAAVAIYARDIAARMALSEREQQLAHMCGLVHDIGKVGLPAGLLEKPGPLSLEERRQMEKHSAIGEGILERVDDYAEIARVVRHHHERVDGNGYPDGLVGAEIPLLARIIAVADAYDAMTSDRPYRGAMPTQVARLRLAQAVSSQFDTTVVAAFEAVLASASEGYRSGSRPDFTFESQEKYRVESERSSEAA